MANTEEVVRLMRHAADLLAANDPAPIYEMAMKRCATTEEVEVAVRLSGVTAAMANAKATLLVIAAALDDEPPREAVA